MNWIGQTMHVATKDFRQLRWPLVAYAAVGVVTTFHAMHLPSGNDSFVVAMPLLMLLGVIIAASVVQNDSPARPHEFWMSRPFFPTAVLAGKVVFTGLAIMALAAAGEAVALSTFGLSSGDVAALLLQSATMYGYWLLGAVVVAALTPDIRSFIVAAMLLVVGLLAVDAVLPSWLLPRIERSSILLGGVTIIGVAGGMTLLAWAYRTRDVGRAAWGGAILVVAALLIRGSAIDRRLPQLPAPADAPHVTLAIEDASHITERRHIRVRLAVDSSASPSRVTFETDTAVLHLRDGSTVPLMKFFSTTVIRPGSVGLPASVRTIAEQSATDGRVVEYQIPFSRQTIDARDIASIDVVGRVSLADAVLVGSMPAAAGEMRTNEGVRVRVEDARSGAAGSTIRLATAVVQPPVGNASRYFYPELSVALVNDAAGEARILHTAANSSSTDWLVLPGVPVSTSTLTLNGNVRGNAPDSSARDEGWYRAARVSVARWNTRARYSVRLSAPMP